MWNVFAWFDNDSSDGMFQFAMSVYVCMICDYVNLYL